MPATHHFKMLARSEPPGTTTAGPSGEQNGSSGPATNNHHVNGSGSARQDRMQVNVQRWKDLSGCLFAPDISSNNNHSNKEGQENKNNLAQRPPTLLSFESIKKEDAPSSNGKIKSNNGSPSKNISSISRKTIVVPSNGHKSTSSPSSKSITTIKHRHKKIKIKSGQVPVDDDQPDSDGFSSPDDPGCSGHKPRIDEPTPRALAIEPVPTQLPSPPVNHRSSDDTNVFDYKQSLVKETDSLFHRLRLARCSNECLYKNPPFQGKIPTFFKSKINSVVFTECKYCASLTMIHSYIVERVMDSNPDRTNIRPLIDLSQNLSSLAAGKKDSEHLEPSVKKMDTNNNFTGLTRNAPNDDQTSKSPSSLSHSMISMSTQTNGCSNNTVRPVLDVIVKREDGAPSQQPSADSRKVRTSNVRIQCKMDQYLSTQLKHLPSAISLSLKTPRLPLPSSRLVHLRYGRYYRVEYCPNGFAKSLHLYWDEIAHLDPAQLDELATEFLKESFHEDKPGVATYVISIVHNGASYMPDWLEWMANKEPSLAVKAGVLGQSDIETTTLSNYRDKVSCIWNFGIEIHFHLSRFMRTTSMVHSAMDHSTKSP